MNENLKLFKQIIKECNYDNTYKMAWAKSLVELSGECDLSQKIIEIRLYKISEKFLKYYWNQTIFFDLRQGSNPVKIPTIVSFTKDLINHYFEVNNTNNPILFEKVDFENNNINEKFLFT